MSARDVDLRPGLTRRHALGGLGFVAVSFSLSQRAFAQGQNSSPEPTGGAQNAGAQPKPAENLPGSLKTNPELDSWIRIESNGKITLFTGKAELGQGIMTALIQIAAEQLVVEPSVITLVTADTQRSPDEGFTAGSHSMQDSGTAILNAAAQVRELILQLASRKMGAPPDQLTAQNGRVLGPGGKAMTYGEIVAGAQFHQQAAPTSALIAPERHRIMGKDFPRVDIPAKVSGGASYVQDLRLPGMVHARVVRPTMYAARLVGVDTNAAAAMPGVLKIVQDGSFLAVVAQKEFQAVSAMRVLADAAKWETTTELPEQAHLFDTLRSMPARDIVVMNDQAAAGAPVKTLSASYLRPYQIHGSIGPSCAVAQFSDGGLTVWTHTQGVFPLRSAIAQMLGLDPQKVRCIHVQGSGCYGHNAADDAAADAAIIAHAFPGRPVRVQWMREQEHQWEPYGSAMLTDVRASLDAGGSIVDWHYEVRSTPHNSRPGSAGNLLGAQYLGKPFAPDAPEPLPMPEGGGDRNSNPLYHFPNANVVYHFIPNMPLRVSALRGLGAYMNVFTIESFMDELARASNQDPVQFRLKHMQDSRARDVMAKAADAFGWTKWTAQQDRGRGFAFARYKNLGAYLAVAAEVEVDRDSGAVRPIRFVAAVDGGEAVNPNGMKNQVEGAIIQSSSWTLFEELHFARDRITSQTWASYPMLRFPSLPDSVDVHIIDRPGQPFLGTGECGQGPTSAALANAIADASGVRLRRIPFTSDRVRSALQA